MLWYDDRILHAVRRQKLVKFVFPDCQRFVAKQDNQHGWTMDGKFSSDGKTTYFHRDFSDFLFLDPEKTGKIGVFKLAEIFGEAGRSIWSYDSGGNRLASALRRNGHTLFVLAQSFEFSPTCYTDFSTKVPVVFVSRIVHVGRTSLVQRRELRIKRTGTVVATMLAQFVYVNLETRRPTPLPESYINTYLDETNGQRPKTHKHFSRFPPQGVEIYYYPVVVSTKDVDENRHTSNTSYIKYCIDCFMFGARERAYSVIQGNLSDYPITNLSLQFVSESDLNDKLTVTSWADTAKPYQVHFVIQKDEREVAQCTLKFDVNRA
ncbi:uncharacterized protein [Ptychodera flava]|uniref:uncharacterized protein n=1 Tax=Ptychodera flava TaxID=63121 RepID=UPI00396A647A